MWRRVHNSDDLDRSITYLQQWIARSGFRGRAEVHEFPAGRVFNHWIVPPKWTVVRASLQGVGSAFVSLDHPLAVMPYSASFRGRVSKDELLRHVRSDETRPDGIPFVFKQMYRHWDRAWGFALSSRVVETLTDSDYDVDLETAFDDQPMKVLEYRVDGHTDRVVQIAAHLDHPGQANDGLSGVAGALMTVHGLEQTFGDLRYTYSVLIGPEIVGSAVYLAANESVRRRIVACLCPNMLGHAAPVALSLSKSRDSRLDRALRLALWTRKTEHVVGLWHKYPDCGDEISYDAPGYDISASTISRVGEMFREYHTSLDTPETVDPGRFDEAVSVMILAMSYLDTDGLPKRLFEGNPCLANPELDLYLDPSNIGNRLNVDSRVTLTDLVTREVVDPRNFQEMFLSNLDGGASLIDIAYASHVPFEFVRGYATAFRDKGLVSLADAGLAPGRVTNVSLTLSGRLSLT